MESLRIHPQILVQSPIFQRTVSRLHGKINRSFGVPELNATGRPGGDEFCFMIDPMTFRIVA